MKRKARTAFEQARVVSDELLREAPEDPARHGQHGLILAALGQKQEAIAEGKRAVELLPESQDAFDGPEVTAALAQIYAWTGEFDEAFRLLDHLLADPQRSHRPDAQARSSLGPAPQRSALSSFDRQVTAVPYLNSPPIARRSWTVI